MHGQLTAILVANDAFVVQALAPLLEEAGFRVIVASEPERALSLLLTARSDVVLMDASDPTPGANEELKRLRTLTAGDVPMIIFDGAGRLARKGDDDPFDPIGITETALDAVA
jgi:CheY-like chemotaxis protein